MRASGEKTSRRCGGRSARISQRKTPDNERTIAHAGHTGCQYHALSEPDILRIHEGALKILETVGMGVIGNIPEGGSTMLEQGARLSDAGRILIPRAMVEDVLAATRREWTLHALDGERNLEISPGHVHFGTAGGAVSIRDFHTKVYRDTTLLDLYDVVRLIDTLPHIHWCYRPLIARDMPTPLDLDINTAYALITGTSKPWGITLASQESVAIVTDMFDMALGGAGRFRETPCCHSVQGDGVPPLRFAEERCKIKEASIRAGIPLMIASAPQAGATSPAALAGTLVQVIAEALAGLVYAHAVVPGHPVAFGPWPFVSDLRTGAMSGGSAEQALLAGASAQMGKFYNLPTSVPAGMADSKAPDAQSGYEKAYTTALAGLAGAGMVHESAGMHGSLMGCILESFVIDNDMLGNILRVVRGIEVTDETLSLDVIADVNVHGPGYYLGHAQTLSLMQSEYRYPALSDRASPAAWEEQGALDIEARARNTVVQTLSTHYPDHISAKLDARYRDRFNILLPKNAMKPGDGRWTQAASIR